LPKPSQSANRAAREPWIESDALASHLAGADAETVAFARELQEQGYAVIDLGAEARVLCDAAVRDTDPYFASGAGRVQDAWRRSRAVRDLAVLPRLVDRLNQVYGRRAFAFQTLNFQRGSQQNVHADTIHFHSAPAGFMCGVWIALEDLEPGCGPLTYYPGSHRLPVLTMRGAGVNRPDPNHDDYVRNYIPELVRRLQDGGFSPCEALLKKGQALVWTANLAHGGAPILRPEATRRTLVVHFFFEDCLYHTPMYSDVEGERLRLRLVPDVATGRLVWPSQDGRRAALPAKTVVNALLDALTRRVHVE
jgi:hypothetical protein